MILALCLLLLNAMLLLFAPALLTRPTGSASTPLILLAAWQLCSWSVLGSIVLAAALLAVPALAAASRLPAGVESCLAALHGIPNPADSVTLRAVAVAVLLLITARIVWSAVRLSVVNHRQRARHRAVLGMVGTADRALGCYVVDDPAALAYCVPGSGGRVVFTTGAVVKLTPEQRGAVLIHERAHLHGRHHLLIASAIVLTRAFPWVALFEKSVEHTARLIELRADDIASQRCGRRPLAEALLALADMTSSPTVLAASAVTTAERIERLLQRDEPSSRRSMRLTHARQVLGAAILVSGLAASPVVLAIAGHMALCEL